MSDLRENKLKSFLLPYDHSLHINNQGKNQNDNHDHDHDHDHDHQNQNQNH
jgi:hypothetical protein